LLEILLKDLDFSIDCVVAEDFNINQNSLKNRGGTFGWDPFRGKMEELIEDWDLLDVKQQRGKFTSSNMHSGHGYVANRLEWFLFHNDFLSRDYVLKSFILLSIIFDHKPISLHLQETPTYNPFPFSFEPLWINYTEVDKMVEVI
jgi:hypothetical protein